MLHVGSKTLDIKTNMSAYMGPGKRKWRPFSQPASCAPRTKWGNKRTHNRRAKAGRIFGFFAFVYGGDFIGPARIRCFPRRPLRRSQGPIPFAMCNVWYRGGLLGRRGSDSPLLSSSTSRLEIRSKAPKKSNLWFAGIWAPWPFWPPASNGGLANYAV